MKASHVSIRRFSTENLLVNVTLLTQGSSFTIKGPCPLIIPNIINYIAHQRGSGGASPSIEGVWGIPPPIYKQNHQTMPDYTQITPPNNDYMRYKCTTTQLTTDFSHDDRLITLDYTTHTLKSHTLLAHVSFLAREFLDY